jgi:serine/threonine-protein kinase
MRALQKDRTQRYESAREMLHGLEDYARKTRLTASPLRFGEWLVEHFGAQILEWRKARERAARALELGPALELKTLVTPAQPAASVDSEANLPVPAPRSDVTASPEPVVDGNRAQPRPDDQAAHPAVLWLLIGVLVAAAAVAAYFLR